MPDMSREDLCALLGLFDTLGFEVWLDGGWAVDAWLGGQTRPHGDLDIEVRGADATRLVAELRSRGYDDVPRDDTRPWNFVLGDAQGRQIDFHLIEIDGAGDGLYGPPETAERIPAAALAGVTELCGRPVRAITPEWLVRFHTGYEPDDDDRADVRALCARFAIQLPEQYRETPLDM